MADLRTDLTVDTSTDAAGASTDRGLRNTPSKPHTKPFATALYSPRTRKDFTDNFVHSQIVADSVPLRSPRDSTNLAADLEGNFDFPVEVPASTYHLQVALKSMKERYRKLQKKMSFLEDENGQLINGKTELFGEIGKMQESSIKLREKNLQLNQEVHSKHQECCSLKEKFAQLSQLNIKLNADVSRHNHESKRLRRQIDSLLQANQQLREGLQNLSVRVKELPGGRDITTLCRVDSLLQATKHLDADAAKTKIIPRPDDLTSMEDFSQVSLTEDDAVAQVLLTGVQPDEQDEEEPLVSLQRLQQEMQTVAAQLLQQKQQLLHCCITQISNMSDGHTTPVQTDEAGVSPMGDDTTGVYMSQYATCGSDRNVSSVAMVHTNDEEEISALMDDSGGDTNIFVAQRTDANKTSPFVWRKVQIASDDEGRDDVECTLRPGMRSVSTSPDLTFLGSPTSSREGGGGEDALHLRGEDRMCPMCNAIFPLVIPQETFEAHVVGHFEVENGFEVI